MRIGLVDVDKTNFNFNLALAKISAYHKSQGDDVEWADPMFGEYDKVYASKVFSFTPDDNTPWGCEVIRGGTGYDIHSALPDCIDRLQPDYSIYPGISEKLSYGFITRGCPNKCKWCCVPAKEGDVHPYMDVDEITQDGRRPDIIAMDNNILASDYGLEQIEKIMGRRYRVDFNQAMSARLVTYDVAWMLARVRWLGGFIRFAADTDGQIAEVENAMHWIDSHRTQLGRKPAFYFIYTIIMGDISDCYRRLSYFKKYPKVRIFAQPYRDLNNPHQVIPQWQKDMAHWSNKRELQTSCDFKDFEPRKGFRCGEYFNNKDLSI